MTEEMHPTTILIGGLLSAAIGIGALFYWLRNRRLRIEKMANPEPWGKSWLDFWLVIWSAFFLFIGLGMSLQGVLLGNRPLEDFTYDDITWGYMIYGLSVQWAMLVTIVGAKWAYKSRYFEISFFEDFPAILYKAALLLVAVMPGIWLVSWFWGMLLSLGGVEPEPQEAIKMMTSIQDPGMFMFGVISAVLVAPILEELFFRGLIQRFLESKVGSGLAVGITSFTFASLHFSWHGMAPLLALGLLLGVTYRRSGDIRLNILIHCLFNLFSVFLIMVEKVVS